MCSFPLREGKEKGEKYLVGWAHKKLRHGFGNKRYIQKGKIRGNLPRCLDCFHGHHATNKL